MTGGGGKGVSGNRTSWGFCLEMWSAVPFGSWNGTDGMGGDVTRQ